MAASDGGIFTFGDAHFYGSTGAIRLNQPIVGMLSTVDGGGYWMAARDGGLFTFGDAGYDGNNVPAPAPVIGITSAGDTYTIGMADESLAPFDPQAPARTHVTPPPASAATSLASAG